MLLCLDVGNSHILGGVYDQEKLIARFRYATHLIGTADQFGLFLLNILEANKIASNQIKATAICSVVPGIDYTLNHAISFYLRMNAFMLSPATKSELIIKIKHPDELGADIIAGAIGAITAFPQQSLIIVDMGTATTVCAVTQQKECLGLSILPGPRLNMESLSAKTANLLEVAIEKPNFYVGHTTTESVQSGLYFGQLGALREIIMGIQQEHFNKSKAMVIGTGGFSQLYKDASIFDKIMPDLVLEGLARAYYYQQQAGK